MSKRIVGILISVLICFGCLGHAAGNGFSKSQQKDIGEKRHRIEMLKEEEKILKSKYSNVRIDVSKAVSERKAELREVRDDANKILKAQTEAIAAEIKRKSNERSLKKKLIISGRNPVAKAYNLLINSSISKIEAEIEFLRQKQEEIKKMISENNEKYRECSKELDNIKKTVSEQLNKINIKYSSLKTEDKKLKEENYRLEQELERFNFKKVKKRYGRIIEIHTSKNSLIKSLTEQKKVINSTLQSSVKKVTLICV